MGEYLEVRNSQLIANTSLLILLVLRLTKHFEIISHTVIHDQHGFEPEVLRILCFGDMSAHAVLEQNYWKG